VGFFGGRGDDVRHTVAKTLQMFKLIQSLKKDVKNMRSNKFFEKLSFL
jgi:hypothetical protein